MSNLKSWFGFLEKQVKAPPLLFVHGFSHSVSRGDSCPVHSHRFFEIVYHPTGVGVTRVKGGHSVSFRDGSAVIYVPHEPHEQMVESEGEDLCVQIAVSKTSHQLPEACLYIPHVEKASAREDLYLLSRDHPGLSRTEQAIYNLRATAVLLELIQTACDCRDREEADLAEQHLLKAEQYIRNYFPSIGSLSEVARHVGVGHDHLRHLFKVRRGKTLVRHLAEVRVDRAKKLLKHSGLPMKQIAAMCGFKDEYYFSAVFRRLAHTTPGAHRLASI